MHAEFLNVEIAVRGCAEAPLNASLQIIFSGPCPCVYAANSVWSSLWGMMLNLVRQTNGAYVRFDGRTSHVLTISLLWLWSVGAADSNDGRPSRMCAERRWGCRSRSGDRTPRDFSVPSVSPKSATEPGDVLLRPFATLGAVRKLYEVDFAPPLLPVSAGKTEHAW